MCWNISMQLHALRKPAVLQCYLHWPPLAAQVRVAFVCESCSTILPTRKSVSLQSYAFQLLISVLYQVALSSTMPAKPTICNHPSAGTLEKADKPLGTSANLMSSVHSSACALSVAARSNQVLGSWAKSWGGVSATRQRE